MSADPSFKDCEGRTWAMRIGVAEMRRVRAALGVNLTDIIDGELAEQLARDMVLLVDVLWVIVQPVAESRGVTDEEFGRAMREDAIDNASNALLEGIAGFFPSKRREPLLVLLRKTKVLQDRLLQETVEKIGEMDVEDLQARKSGEKSTESLEPSESTPGPSPSES